MKDGFRAFRCGWADVGSCDRVYAVHEHAPVLQHRAIATVELDEPLHGERLRRTQFHGAEFGALAAILSENAIHEIKPLTPRPRDPQRDVNDLMAWICD